MCLISGLVSFVDPAAFLSSHLIGWPVSNCWPLVKWEGTSNYAGSFDTLVESYNLMDHTVTLTDSLLN